MFFKILSKTATTNESKKKKIKQKEHGFADRQKHHTSIIKSQARTVRTHKHI